MKMRKSIHKFLALALAICMLVPMLAACGKEVDAATIMSQYRISNTAIDLSVGDVTGLSVMDETLSDVEFTETWASSNPAVVIADKGIITAVGAGTAVVTVTITREDEIAPFDLTCNVTVTQDVINVQSIILNKNTAEIVEGSSDVLTAVVLPTDATDKNITWTSSDETVATVYGGVVTGLKAGTATITATSADGLISASCEVTVKALVDVLTKFTLNKSSSSLYIGNTTTLKVTYEPADADVAVVWSSSDPSVATVTDGVVKAIATGTATITASYSDNVTVWEKTCKVTVSKKSTSSEGSGNTTPPTPTTIKATDVELDEKSYYKTIGDSWTIKATVKPSNTTEKGTWTSSDPSLVTIDSNGNAKVVVASLKENALETVTLTYKVGSVKAAAVVILQAKGSGSGSTTPSTPSTEINLTSLGFVQQTVSVGAQNSIVLSLTKNPVNANETLTWTSADPTIATVDANGKVTGIKAGYSTVIYVKSSRTGMTATCVVSVTSSSTAATSITLNTTNLALELNGFATITATMMPSNATDTITWISSNPMVATVDATGKVTAVAMGQAIITATTTSGKTAQCIVSVSAATVKNVTVKVVLSASGDLTNTKSYTASLSFTPALSASDMASCYLDIYSDNRSVVDTELVDLTGSTNRINLIVGEDGVTTLNPWVHSTNPNLIFTFVPLTVSVSSPSDDIKTPVKSITLSIANGSKVMYAGDKIGLSVKVTPEMHDDTLTWVSSDTSVATVENGVVTAVAPGTAVITYKAKGNLTTNGVSKSITVSVQSTGSINEAAKRIMIQQGTSFQLTLDPSVGKVIYWNMPTTIAGVTLVGDLLTIDASVPAATNFQVNCYCQDAMGQPQIRTYYVVVQRAASSSSGEAFAKYSITVEDDTVYNWSNFGLNFGGYTVVDTYTDDCSITTNSNVIKASLIDDDKGFATIEIRNGATKIAEVSVTVVGKDFTITMGKSSTVDLETYLKSYLDVSSVSIISISVDSKYSGLVEKTGSTSIKGKGTKGTAYVDIAYVAGTSSGVATATIVLN